MCSCNRVIQTTKEVERLSKILMILFVIDIVLVVVKIIFHQYESLFSFIISLILLFCSFSICHYLLCSFLLFFSLFDIFFSLVFLCQRIQNHFMKLNDIYLQDSFYKVAMYIEIANFVYLIVLCYFTFQAYKEFKAVMMGSISPSENSYQEVGREEQEKFKPFSGKGYTVGGS